MIRLRSTKLLSGVSTLAVLTCMAATPAQAATTFTGVNIFPVFTNTAETDTITVSAHATVNSDDTTGAPDLGNSIINQINMTGTGNKITVDDSVLAGGINNNAGFSITSSDLDAILFTNHAVMAGGLINSGTLSGGTNGVEVNNSHILRGFFNDVGATIVGATNGIAIVNNSSFLGGISNEGAITGTSGDGIRMGGVNTDFFGGITNYASGAITGNGAGAAGIDMGFGGAISNVVDNIDNAGTIQGFGGANGIFINATTFDGSIINRANALIQATGTSAFGITITGGAFTGSISNAGQILATGTSGVAVSIGGTTVFTGDVTNDTGGIMHAAATALGISGTSFTGNVTNRGQILSDSGTAVSISTATFAGNLTNESSGVIDGSGAGVSIASTGFTGNVTNHGAIYGGDGLRVETGAVLTGSIDNDGTIIGETSAGVRIRGTVSGTVSNEGLIQGSGAGISVESTIAGGITNSGTITGTQSVDLQLATGATTITQTAGLMEGVLRLDQSGAEFDDTVNLNGGQLRGNIDGGGGDDINVGGNVAYVNGTADQLDQVNVNAGTAVFGSTAVGTDGVGVTFTNTNAMTIADGATAYLDDNTTIGLNNDLTVNSGGRLSYFLTSDTTTHGRINAGGNANLDGTLHAVIDGTSFASIGGDTFVYTNIITGTVSGTFADVTTSSLFFDAQAIYHANAVDLELDRLSFNDALTLGTLTHNQASVGGALEDIYAGGTFGTDFEDLFNYLLNLPSGSQSDVAAIYDELGGAEHAQVQQATLRATEPFDTAIGDRLDEAKLGLHGTGWAQNGERRYADAAQQQRMMSDAAPAQRSDSQGLLRGSTGVSIWGRGYGDWTDTDGDSEAPGYKQDSAGVVGGLDFAIGGNAVVGGAFGWSTSSLDFDTPRDHADIDSFEFGGYGSYGFGRFYADGQLSFAFHDVNATRELDLGFDTFIAGSSYNSRSWTLAGEVGTVFTLGKLNMQPMVGVNYTGASTDGFIESGAGDFSLVVADADTNSFTSTLGMRVSGLWTVGGTKLVPDASIAWRHEFADTRQSFSAAFLDAPSTPFDIVSSKISPDSALVNAGLTAGVTQGLELFVDYNGVLNSDATSHNGSAGFRATW